MYSSHRFKIEKEVIKLNFLQYTILIDYMYRSHILKIENEIVN